MTGAPVLPGAAGLEGAALAGSGAVGSAALLAFVDGATDGPWNTIGQLAVVAGLCAWLGPRSVEEVDRRRRARRGRT